jgi:hypothetical protein
MNPELDPKLQQEQPTVNVVLTVNELNIVFAGLQELPHKVSDFVLRKIGSQVQPQLQQK